MQAAWESLTAYNTRVVLSGTMLLGVAAGVVGTFLVLRRRALAGDVIGHAALPGVCAAFLLLEIATPGSGKSLPWLLLGGAIGSAAGMLAVVALRSLGGLPDDASLATVLSGFFGGGVVLLGVVQASPSGSQAGLRDFLFGQAAAMQRGEAIGMGAVALLAIVAVAALRKEWTLVCFDEAAARVMGYPILALDLALMTLVVVICVVGMQSVGLLLVVALLIIPASGARFWSDRVGTVAVIAGLQGGTAALLGAALSALVPRLSTGAVIVLAAAALFVLSSLFGTQHGKIRREKGDWRSEIGKGRLEIGDRKREIGDRKSEIGGI